MNRLHSNVYVFLLSLGEWGREEPPPSPTCGELFDERSHCPPDQARNLFYLRYKSIISPEDYDELID